MNAKDLGGVVRKDFGELLQDAGIKTVIVDNDRKANSTIVRDD